MFLFQILAQLLKKLQNDSLDDKDPKNVIQ